MANRINKLTVDEYSGRIALKVLRVDERNGHKFVSVIDKDSTRSTLIFWASESYLAEALEANKWQWFDELKGRKKFAPNSRNPPKGVDLVFDVSRSKADGIEVKARKSPEGIPIMGVTVFEEGLPVLKSSSIVKLKAGEMKFVESNASLPAKIQTGQKMYVEPALSLLEKSLMIPAIPIPNQDGKIHVPVINFGRTQAELPLYCLLGKLTLQNKTRIRFTTAETVENDENLPSSDNDEDDENEDLVPDSPQNNHDEAEIFEDEEEEEEELEEEEERQPSTESLSNPVVGLVDSEAVEENVKKVKRSTVPKNAKSLLKKVVIESDTEDENEPDGQGLNGEGLKTPRKRRPDNTQTSKTDVGKRSKKQ